MKSPMKKLSQVLTRSNSTRSSLTNSNSSSTTRCKVWSTKKSKSKSVTLDCSSTTDESTITSLLEQLESPLALQITHLTLRESLERPDNVRLFTALSKLVSSPSCKLQRLELCETVPAAQYRRWSFKKTNFLHHVYRQCHDQNIHVVINGTLVLETLPDKPQDVSSWLVHLAKTVPEDKDITALTIKLCDVASSQYLPRNPPRTALTLSASGKPRSRRHLVGQSAVEQVFQALIELVNSSPRVWQLIDCHILYTAVPKYGVPQTEALVETAEVYDIPLQVTWEPLDDARRATCTWIRRTSKADYVLPPLDQTVVVGHHRRRPCGGTTKKDLEDTTASTVCDEGSSGQLFLSY